MDKSIMPECFADTLLIETLVPTKTGYNHKHNCFKVESEMSKGKLKNQFALGIIDNDKKTIRYLSEFEQINACEDLILWKHKERSHFIIQICPALEMWILKVCDKAKIDIEAFKLKNDLEGLKKITKHLSSIDETRERNVKLLKDLFKAIKSTEVESVVNLINWVTILKEKNYQVDINELR